MGIKIDVVKKKEGQIKAKGLNLYTVYVNTSDVTCIRIEQGCVGLSKGGPYYVSEEGMSNVKRIIGRLIGITVEAT